MIAFYMLLPPVTIILSAMLIAISEIRVTEALGRKQ